MFDQIEATDELIDQLVALGHRVNYKIVENQAKI